MIKKKLTVLKINNFFSKNKISISEIQKFIKEKKFLLQKKKYNKKIYDQNLYALSRTFLVSLIMISIFVTSPKIINFTKQNMIYSKDYTNNSKNNLVKF